MDRLDELVTFIRTAKKLALFAGAGVSMRVGLPDWPRLLNNLANQLRSGNPLAAAYIDQSVRDDHLLFAATLFSDDPKTTPHRKRELLRAELTAQSAQPLASLVALPFGSIFTTNFDRTLLDAYAAVHHKAPIEFHYGSTSFVGSITEPNFHVTRVHGRIEGQDPLVFSIKEYDNALKDSAYHDVLRNLFTQRQLLIVGFSFIDPAFQAVLDTIERIYASRSAGEHLALVPDDASDSFLAKLTRLNIRQLKYSPAADHADLWQLI